MARIEVNVELCKGCELCLAACPYDLLSISEDFNSKGNQFAQQLDSTKCTACKLCAIMCPDAAISVYS